MCRYPPKDNTLNVGHLFAVESIIIVDSLYILDSLYEVHSLQSGQLSMRTAYEAGPKSKASKVDIALARVQPTILPVHVRRHLSTELDSSTSGAASCRENIIHGCFHFQCCSHSDLQLSSASFNLDIRSSQKSPSASFYLEVRASRARVRASRRRSRWRRA